ncbi:hypothetical protein Calhy_0338 [Caldicellulosiruptor hydrothermalis 108]|uniref:Uncharacterized protein n=1 Tax=Caldicellulosiruptor hydrothermalis (strain DSM 18901 / VKM B-2411 / 108) TaxID=632292 RepID=E4QBI4_CALH1|nr:hypothetical protein [Caldicellulosiruptor hydrothermalis]ADQ06086.1 hypothetical protein Calhy_0338 [Caldicellulosiruptor hydrothermalis 108]
MEVGKIKFAEGEREKCTGVIHTSSRRTEEDSRRIEWIRRHWRIPENWNVEPVELVERCSYVPGSYIGYRIVNEQGQTVYYGVLRPVR